MFVGFYTSSAPLGAVDSQFMLIQKRKDTTLLFNTDLCTNLLSSELWQKIKPMQRAIGKAFCGSCNTD